MPPKFKLCIMPSIEEAIVTKNLVSRTHHGKVTLYSVAM